MGWRIASVILEILFSLCVAALAVGVIYFYNYAVVRPKKEFSLEQMEGFWGTHSDEVLAGIDYFRSLNAERVSITSCDGLKLYASYAEAENSVGTVILMHGYHGSAENDFSVIFRFYRERGFNILAPDQRAHGESEGKIISFGIRERFDCRDWAVFASKRRPDLPILLDGVSMGATTVLMASGLELPGQVRGIVADCGFTSPHAIYDCVIKSVFKLPPFPFVPATGLCIRVFGGFGIDEYSTLEAMKTNRLPVLFVHGEDDTFVPPEMTKANYEACRAEKVLLTVPGAGHAQSCLVDREKCESALEEFIEKHVI